MDVHDWEEDRAKAAARWLVAGTQVSIVHVARHDIVNATVLAHNTVNTTVRIEEGEDAGAVVDVPLDLVDKPLTADAVPEAVARMKADIRRFLRDAQRASVDRYMFEGEQLTFEEAVHRVVEFSAEGFVMRRVIYRSTLVLLAAEP